MSKESTAVFAAKLNESIMARPERRPAEVISAIAQAVAKIPQRELSLEEMPQWLALARQISAQARAGAIAPTGEAWRSFKAIFDKLGDSERRRALGDIATMGSANPAWQNALVAAAANSGIAEARSIPPAQGEARKPLDPLSEREAAILLILSGIQEGAMLAAKTQQPCDAENEQSHSRAFGLASWLSGHMALAETLSAAAKLAPEGAWREQGFNRHFTKLADIALSAAGGAILAGELASGRSPAQAQGAAKCLDAIRLTMSQDEANGFFHGLATSSAASAEWRSFGGSRVEQTTRESIQEAINRAIPEAFEPAAPRGWLAVVAARIGERRARAPVEAEKRRSGP